MQVGEVEEIAEGLARLVDLYDGLDRLPDWEHWGFVAETVHLLAVPVLAAGYACAIVVGLLVQVILFSDPVAYAAGYYSYKWAEVLDADAFDAFKEKGLFDPDTARRFRTLLEKGGSEDAMKLYLDFRGRAPSVKPLLRKLGFDGPAR